MVVQHNINAMTAYNKLNVNVTGLKKSSEKLASGYRINRAGDDAAGLAISEKMRSQIKGLNQAVRNSQDGINMIQTFEGAATNTHEILQRMKVLAEEASNGTYQNQIDRDALQLEFDQLNNELNQIADTDFNGVVALNGGIMADGTKVKNPLTPADVGETSATSSAQDIIYYDPNSYSVSYDEDGNVTGVTVAGQALKGTADDTDPTKFVLDANQEFTINGVTYKTSATAKANSIQTNGKGVITAATLTGATGSVQFDQLDETLSVNGVNMTYKLDVKGQTYYSDGTTVYDENGTEFKNVNEFVDKVFKTDFIDPGDGTMATGKISFANAPTITWTEANPKLPAGDVSVSDAFKNGRRNLTYTDSITLQTGARSKDAVEFTFAYSCDGMGNLNADLDISARGLGTNQLNVKTAEDANYAIDQIDNAINKTSMIRATFGSIQNRLEYKIDNLTTTSTNLQEAESNIRDTDMANEMMNYTKYSILQQAAQSMLAQANQQPQSILQLLG